MSRAGRGRRPRAGPPRPAIVLAALLAAGAATGGPARAGEARAPFRLALGAGAAEIVDPDTTAFVTFELRQAFPPRRPAPWFAAEATRRDRFFGLGVGADFPLGARVVVTPAFGGTMYLEHDGIGLGWHLEFRSSIEVTAAAGRARVGARLAHYSNAGLGETNPGTETLTVVWIVPVGGARPSAAGRGPEPAAVLHQDHGPGEHEVGRRPEPRGDVVGE